MEQNSSPKQQVHQYLLQQQQRLLIQHQQKQHHHQLYDLHPQHYFSEDLSPTHTSPPTSASAAPNSWPPHRTSNTREEVHPRQPSHQFFPQQPQLGQSQLKRESTMADRTAAPNGNPGPPSATRSSDDPMPSTSDFVKKLYKMLEDPAFQAVVSWGPQGDCFVVKDMNDFTKSILPRMFKHSNFASFVRQLNKYDFHKVKNTDDNQFGEHSWTFRHPDFHADRRDALENIKRKVPAARKAQQSVATHPLSSHPYPAVRGRSTSPSSLGHGAPHLAGLHTNAYGSPAVLQAEVQRLRDEGEDLRGRIRNLERNYESVLVEMVGFQRGMAQQDGLMQNLIACFLGSESGKLKAAAQNGVAAAQGLRNILPVAGGSNEVSLSPGASSEPSSAVERKGSASAANMSQLHAQLKQQQSKHERVQVALQTQLNQVVRERERNERDRTYDQSQGLPSTSQLQWQQQLVTPAQQESLQPQSSSQYPASMGGLSSLSDDATNPFLPPHAVQHIIGFSASNGNGSPFSNGGELGKASLLQMNELSRRAAHHSANGGTGNLWDGMDFTADNAGSGVRQPQGANRGPAVEARDQMRDVRGWGSGGESVERTKGESAGPLLRDDSSTGLRIGTGDVPELKARGRRRRRQSDSCPVLPDTRGASGSFPPNPYEEYVVPSQQGDGIPSASSSREQPQECPSGPIAPPFASSSRTESQSKQKSVGNPWASLMSGQPLPFLNMLGSSSQPEFGGTSGAPYGPVVFTADDDGSLAHEGLQVFTVGHLLPKGVGISGGDDMWDSNPKPGTAGAGGVFSENASGMAKSSEDQQQGERQRYTEGSGAQFAAPLDPENEEEEVVQASPANTLITAGAAATLRSSSSSGDGSQKLRVRRATYVPGWAVPPRVLLVDDDAVSRKLSSKFLKVFGCTIDVAVDGVGAVNKMNLEKYDLVLMDIVMPKLDGVSATSLIRKFDQGTPIISMTSNSKPNEIMTYYSSGMNDILPKPFTKEGLLEMLEKHLMHLKVIQQMSRLPRSVGAPMIPSVFSTNSNNFLSSGVSMRSNLIESSAPNATTSVSVNFFGDVQDGWINPIAGMGLTEEEYTMVLRNIVNEDGITGIVDENMPTSSAEKRPLDDQTDDGRSGKRSRFEIIE